MKFRHLLLAGSVLLFIAQTAYYYPILPETVSSHFDGVGDPNGWMSKANFLWLEFVIFGLIVAEGLFLPWLVEKMPDSLINLPNKEYWLAPERRSYAFEVFKAYFQWFSIGLLLLIIFVNQLVYQANLTRRPLDSLMWLLLGVYLAFVIAWLIKFITAFRKPV